jgi:3-phosphoshikimate 1-carboxyvinyltransferase
MLMKREFKPVKKVSGTITVPGDKSIAHRIALLSILANDNIEVNNFPENEDCQTSLNAVEIFGVKIEKNGDKLKLIPPESISLPDDTIIDCGNSGTTARLLAGILAGSNLTATLAGDKSLSNRPMKRIIEPLKNMGAEIFTENDQLPMKIQGNKLLSFEYRLPIPSAQVKSALLLAGLASKSSITIKEDILSRDHTERMLSELGNGIEIREIKPELIPDEHDPRKKRMVMPENFKKEIKLKSNSVVSGGQIDIPGDISSAAYFMAAAAISKQSIVINNLGLNPTRIGFIEHLKAIGCQVSITDRHTFSGEPRGNVTVTGGELKARKISGETTLGMIDEMPIVAVLASFAKGTTVIRDSAELKLKESNRLLAISENLKLAGVKCGLLEDGLAIEGGTEFNGADFLSFGDHRIAMAFSIASLFAVGPSSLDDSSVVGISFPKFYEILSKITE